MTRAMAEADLQHIADRVKAVGGGRERGPVGMEVGARPQQFRMALLYTKLARKLEKVEVLLNAAQRADWLARNARAGSSRKP